MVTIGNGSLYPDLLNWKSQKHVIVSGRVRVRITTDSNESGCFFVIVNPFFVLVVGFFRFSEKKPEYFQIAQIVERLPEVQKVVGANPILGTVRWAGLRKTAISEN